MIRFIYIYILSSISNDNRKGILHYSRHHKIFLASLIICAKIGQMIKFFGINMIGFAEIHSREIIPALKMKCESTLKQQRLG